MKDQDLCLATLQDVTRILRICENRARTAQATKAANRIARAITVTQKTLSRRAARAGANERSKR